MDILSSVWIYIMFSKFAHYLNIIASASLDSDKIERTGTGVGNL